MTIRGYRQNTSTASLKARRSNGKRYGHPGQTAGREHSKTIRTEKLRVAAYCRVSTDSEEQETSYEAQVTHYTEYIQKNPEWELAGIFADDGISGTNTKSVTSSTA